MPRLAILRLRQPKFVAEGLPDPRLRQIVAAVLGESEASFSARQITNDTHRLPLDLTRDLTAEAELLANLLVARARRSAVVLVDLQLDDLHSLPFDLQMLLFRSFDVIGAQWPATTQLVLFVTKLPTTNDLIRKACQPLILGGNVTIIDANGRYIRSTVDAPAEALVQTAARTADDARSYIEDRVLRRRGVFGVASSPGQYSLFRYSIDAAREELADLLAEHVTEKNATVMLYDDLGGPWLGEAITRASSKLNRLPFYLISDLEKSAVDSTPADALMSADVRRALQDPDQKICVVLPMVNTRSRVNKVASVLAQHGHHSADYLAVFVPVGHSQDVADEDRYSGDSLFEVPMRRVEDTSWEVTAAASRDELNLLEKENGAPTTVAMLTLMAQYGIGPESHAPRGRRAVSHFPQVDNLDPWDAYWLADSLIKQAKNKTGRDESELLIVMPDDSNASKRLAEALESRLSVPVATISRTAMRWVSRLKPSSRDLLLAFKSRQIVVADESAVSYRTLRRIRHVVDRVTGRHPNLYGVVFDFGNGMDRPEPLISFHHPELESSKTAS